MQIFQRNILNKYIENFDVEMIAEHYQQFADYFLNPERQENIHNSKEEQFQEGFLRELFVKILGYTLNPDPGFNLTTEKKNETNSKKADGAILVNGEVVGVIELKDHKTTDLSKVEAQAFNYKSQHKEAVYVVISNFEKLRFYIDNAVDFEEFDLFHLTKEDFARLWVCLAYENIEKDVPKQIKSASLTNEDQITNALYKDYSNFKRDLFEDIIKNNLTDSTEHKILLFKKTQKLLDRLLFIFFAEDRGLLPPNSIMLIINQWEKLRDLDEYQPFYNRLKKYFGYMNTGYQGKNYEVFAYNGGLFKPDEILDGLNISDEVLIKYCKRISEYDFQSDVDVNILGHIFENSLTEIEEITTKLQQGEAPTISKRKKDGVFYTPQYITKYIVENTIGKLCREKKAELGIDDSEYFADKKRQMATKKALIEKLDAYREWLLQISICDPACGSGAFLNAALNFLMAEHKLIDEMSAKVEGAAIVFPNVENSILENNLYGVDINEESVEIAKLSLWLRTAKPHRKLNSLNSNIKCGNSLIDDPAIAGEKAFCWEKEFPQVFREKQKKAWHITTAVHDSRTSERMVEYEVRRLRDQGSRPNPEPMLLSEEEEIIITETVSKIVREDKLNLLAYNICFDHMHLLLVCEEEEVPKIVGKIKSMTARAVNIAMGRTVPMMETPIGTTAAATRGHAPLSVPAAENLPDEKPSGRGDTQCPLWTQKFGNTYIDSDEHLYNAIQYIQTNREHHDLPLLPVEYPPCVSIEEAFRPEYTGGFDVVIGNPPYVRADSPGNTLEFRNYMTSSNCWETLAGKWDLYIPFLELGIKISKEDSFCSFIIPDAYCHAEYGKQSLDYMESHRYLSMIDYFPDIDVFENVGVKSVIVHFIKRGAERFVQRIHDTSQQYAENILTDYPSNLRIDAKQSVLQGKEGLLPLNNICYLSVGIVGNSDEKLYKGEFEVGDLLSDIKDDIHSKLYYEGKDVGKWRLLRERYIEYGTERSPKKWRRKGFTELFEGSAKLVTMRSPGNMPRTMLDNDSGYFNESAIGFKRWSDLRGVQNGSVSKAYQSEEERNNFEKLSEAYSYHLLLGIFNSSLIRYELNTNRRSNIHIYPDDWKSLLIPNLDNEKNKEIAGNLENAVAVQISSNQQLQQKRQRFLRRLQDNLGLQKVTAALEHFDELDFKAFVAELKKQKIILSLAQQDEWEDYFNQYKADCNALSAQITATDKEIDCVVYELYGLSEDEIKVVEGE